MLPLAAVNQFESDATLWCSTKDKAQPEHEIHLEKLPAPVVTLYAVARSERVRERLSEMRGGRMPIMSLTRLISGVANFTR